MFRYFILIACFCSFSDVTALDTVAPLDIVTTVEVNGWMLEYDRNRDGLLDSFEFHLVCDALFRNETLRVPHHYPLSRQQEVEIFQIFDQNADSVIDYRELTFCYKNWIETIIHPRSRSAFLVIDVQNDFISGPLDIRHFPARHNGEDVIKPINKLLDTVPFKTVYYSLDTHPDNHISFIDNVRLRRVDPSSPVQAANAKVFDTVVFEGPPKTEQTLWPKHCVQDTYGAKPHKDLKIVHNNVPIYKGRNPEVDSYSVFWDNNKSSKTELHDNLMKEGITDVYISGLAYDVCVGASAKDAQSLGYRVILIDDCARGVDPAGIEAIKESVRDNHGLIVHSSQVKAMVEGLDRRPELGYKLALELKKRLG